MADGRIYTLSGCLRRNMTPQERRLWYGFLAGLPVPVIRQQVIGDYIVDFYIPDAGLVIELDGSLHYTEEGEACDRRRDRELKSMGLKVARYSNTDVNRCFKGVCEDIMLRMGLEI